MRTAPATAPRSRSTLRTSASPSRLDGTAQPGPAVLHVRFRGVLNDQLRGFYRSTFKDEAGNDKVIAVTQFESTSARRAFPCWDEPDLKAVFSITLVVEGELTALANTKQISDERTGDGRRRVRFADTMPLSTYLVAFIVGELELTEPIDVDGVPLRIVHQPGKQRAHGLRRGVRRVRHPLLRRLLRHRRFRPTSSTSSRLPDFAAGAMENLGLRHVPRGAAAGRPGDGDAGGGARRSRTSSRTRSRTCGSATS